MAYAKILPCIQLVAGASGLCAGRDVSTLE
jgi:hypothetical protein